VGIGVFDSRSSKGEGCVEKMLGIGLHTV